MKLLLCSPVVGASKTNPGGIAVWEQNIINHYKEHPDGIHIDVQSCDRKEYINENTGKLKRVWCGIKDYLRIINEINAQFNNFHYDAVHMCTTASLSLIKDYVVFRIAKKRGIQTILHFHFGRIPRLFKEHTWETKLLKRVLKITDKIIVMDNFSYDTLMANGYENVFNVPNPLAPSVIREIEKYPISQRKKGRILYAGRVFRLKGIYELVEACKDIPNIELRMVGHVDSIDKQALTEIANGGTWLNFVGPVPHDQVMKELLECDVFVLPSYSEGFPNAIIESMACGTPTIATPVGAMPDMLNVNGEACGICVPVKDVTSLREALVALLVDEEKKELYGKRAKKRVMEMYSINAVWKMLCDVWKK